MLKRIFIGSLARARPGRDIRVLLLALACPWPAAAVADPLAIWQRAVAHMRADQPQAALPLLRDLVAAAPDVATVRLELALALLRTGDSAASRREFRRALRGEVSPAERKAGEAYLAALEDVRVWRFGLSGALAPQSNAARRNVRLSEERDGIVWSRPERAESGIGARFNLSAGLHPPASGTARARLVLTLAGTVYQRRAWNDYTLGLEAGVLHHPTTDRAWDVALVAQQRWIGDKAYTLEAGGRLGHSLMLGPTTRLQLGVEVLRLKDLQPHPTLPPRDGPALRLSAQFSHLVSPTLMLHGGVALRRTRAVTGYDSGRALGLAVGMVHLSPEGWKFGLAFSHQTEQRAGPIPLAGLTMREHEQRLRVQVSNANIRWMGFLPELEIGYERKRSNIPLASWGNAFAGISLSRGF